MVGQKERVGGGPNLARHQRKESDKTWDYIWICLSRVEKKNLAPTQLPGFLLGFFGGKASTFGAGLELLHNIRELRRAETTRHYSHSLP